MAKGGKRKNAGRKPGKRNRAQLEAIDVAKKVLGSIDQEKIWKGLVRCRIKKVACEAMKYLSDRAYGKPQQSLTVGGDAEKPLEVIIRTIGKA